MPYFKNKPFSNSYEDSHRLYDQNNEDLPITHFMDFEEDETGRQRTLDDTYTKMLASELISDSVQTPCDRSQFVQVLLDPNDESVLVAVQKIDRNVRPISEMDTKDFTGKNGKRDRHDYWGPELSAFDCRCEKQDNTPGHKLKRVVVKGAKTTKEQEKKTQVKCSQCECYVKNWDKELWVCERDFSSLVLNSQGELEIKSEVVRPEYLVC